MRGGVGITDTMANPLSFIRIPIRPGESPRVIHDRIYDLLETGMHWVMLRWIRFFANRRRLKFPPVRSTGCFSNLGSFTTPDIDRVITCPPTGPTEPLATCLVTWNGQMSAIPSTGTGEVIVPFRVSVIRLKGKISHCGG